MVSVTMIFKNNSENLIASKGSAFILCHGLIFKKIIVIETRNDHVVHCTSDLEAEKLSWKHFIIQARAYITSYTENSVIPCY